MTTIESKAKLIVGNKEIKLIIDKQLLDGQYGVAEVDGVKFILHPTANVSIGSVVAWGKTPPIFTCHAESELNADKAVFIGNTMIRGSIINTKEVTLDQVTLVDSNIYAGLVILKMAFISGSELKGRSAPIFIGGPDGFVKFLGGHCLYSVLKGENVCVQEGKLDNFKIIGYNNIFIDQTKCKDFTLHEKFPNRETPINISISHRIDYGNFCSLTGAIPFARVEDASLVANGLVFSSKDISNQYKKTDLPSLREKVRKLVIKKIIPDIVQETMDNDVEVVVEQITSRLSVYNLFAELKGNDDD